MPATNGTGNQVLPKRMTMAYNALDQRTQIARFQSTGTANPVATTDFTYDTANRLSGMAHKQGATNLNTYAYTYDPLSRLATVDSTLDGLTSYNYNQNDELQGASNTGAPNESYGYDANGNRNTNGFTTASDNRMTASRGFTYLYDNEGNLTRRTNTISGAYTTYTWDHRNRLTKVTENARESEINYEYDAFNRLVRRHDAVVASYTPVTYWVYDEGTNPVLEYFGGNPLIQHRYVWSDKVDDLLADEQNPGLSSRNTLWALSDHLGSIRDIADTSESTGTTSIANHRRYDSFGRRVWETNDAVDLVFGYTGKLFDETTRLQNNLNRWYDSSTGRWISQDPIGFAGGDANLYRYVGNSPTNATDPSGLVTSQDPPFQRGWGGFFWDWTGGLFFPSTQTAHSKAISLAAFANHENNVDRTRANANARVFQQLDPNFGVGQNRPSPPAGVMSGQENGLQQAETAIRAAAELPVEFMAAASGMSRPSSGGASITGGGSGNPKANAPRSTPSLREQYLGRTPGKGSRNGRQVIERMETEGNLRWNGSGGAEVRYVDPVTKAESWHPLNSTDMGHLHDAVKYWNETGRTLGPKHPDVRKWMLDPANYELQPSSINRSNGARLKDRYMPPLGDE